MSTNRDFFLKPWLYIVIVIVGVALKFYQLDSKLFWRDEVSTVLYTSGVNDNVIQHNIPVNQIRNFGYYDSLLHVNAMSYSIISEVKGVLSGTHLTPAHYVFLTFWYRIVGDTDMDYRLFSVFIFILSLPVVFLFAENLFDSPLAGWIALSLYAVSPFIQFEAQEARYYMLWVFFFALSNYLFLQAIKHNKFLWWVGYSFAAILALYTSITSGAFIFGHLMYILLFKKQLRIRFLVFISVIGLTYLPWMYFLYTRLDDIENGLAWHKYLVTPYFPLDLLLFQLLGFVRQFVYLFEVDFFQLLTGGPLTKGMYSYVSVDIAMLAFIIYSIIHLLLTASKRVKWFLVLLILPLVLLFLLSDVFRHSGASMLWDYQIVNMVAGSFVVTNLLKDKISQGKPVFIGIYLSLILLSISSILEIAANRCWNTSPDCKSNVEDARSISKAAHALIITDFSSAGLVNFMAVLNDSKAKGADILYGKGKLTDLTEKIAGRGYSDIYVLHASDSLAQQVRLQFGKRMLPLRKDMSLFIHQMWQIKL